MDIVRDLLRLTAETAEPSVDAYTLAGDSTSRELIAYHVRTMTQAGLIESYVKPDGQSAPASCFMFWSSDILTGSPTFSLDEYPAYRFWSSDILTGSPTTF